MNRRIAKPSQRTEGSTLVTSLLMLIVLILIGGNLLRTVIARYDYTQKSIGWAKALPSAEAGAEFGLANCRWSVNAASTPWAGWKKFDSATQTWVPTANTADAGSELSAGRSIVYDLPAGSHLFTAGEGSTQFWYHVEVDSPTSMSTSGNPWYRIRSTGYAALPGLARSNNDSPDGGKTHNDLLRKLDLRNDHFIKRYGDYANAAGTTVAVTPRAARRIEVVARPRTVFPRTFHITAASGTPLGVPTVDSYDPTDTVNYPGGLYSSTPRNVTTGIGTNATVYINAPISTLEGSYYGNIETNGGTLAKTSNISGTVVNDVSLIPPKVSVPSWATVATGSAPSSVTAGTSAAPLYKTYSSLNGMTVKLPAGQTTGVANIYVTGDVKGGITVAKGVTLNLWFGGNFKMKAAEIENLNNAAANLQLYGIDPPTGQARSFDVTPGAPSMPYFVLCAPGYDFFTHGNPDFCGSWVVKTLTGNGNTAWHYDETLGTVGLVTDYKRASWVEDER